MRILVYEFVTGGGWYSADSCAPPASLLAEGTAMLAALAADFAAVEDLQVDVMRDRRHTGLDAPNCVIHEVGTAGQERDTLVRLAAAADWSVIIAPEFDGHLLKRCRWVEAAGGRLLGPDAATVALASSKQQTAEHLAAHGVNVPGGVVLAPGEPLPQGFRYPAVLKPVDGAGSQDTFLIGQPRDCADVRSAPMRLEEFCPGEAVSVACLRGPRGIVLLAGCRQLLSDDGCFTYLGGSLPLEVPLARRAARLARRAIATLDDSLGYLGVDLVLGADPRGADDVVVEINPRLTTSYVGLRALARQNLASAMLDVAAGREVELSWQQGPIQFDATGQVWRQGASAVAATQPAARRH